MLLTNLMKSKYLMLAALLCLAPTLSVAQETEAEEAPMEETSTVPEGVEQQLTELVETVRESSEEAHRYNLETLGCGEFDQLVHSDSQADKAVVSMLLVWAHGYKSGLEGIDFQARPASLDGMTELVRQAIEECEQHPEMLFHVAIGRID